MKLSGRALALGDLVFKWTTWESKGLSQWANWKKCQLWANWKNGFNFNAHGLHCPLKSPTYDRKSPIQWKGFPDKIVLFLSLGYVIGLASLVLPRHLRLFPRPLYSLWHSGTGAGRRHRSGNQLSVIWQLRLRTIHKSTAHAVRGLWFRCTGQFSAGHFVNKVIWFAFRGILLP